MAKVFSNVIEAIGNTPIIKLNRVIPEHLRHHEFYAKIEYMNPGGSVKDRIGISIIEEAEKRGELKPGGTIIEATSGNTGMGLAMVAAVRGYKAIFVMPDKISEEKRAQLRAFGAKVVITPTGVEPDDPRSFYSVAKKLVEITPNSFYANQYHNPDNPKKHYETTGPEIWEQMGGKLDFVVAGAGTGGTISGIGKFLKERDPKIKMVCPDPVGSILFDLFYFKEVREAPASYKVEGVGEDMLPENVHFNVIDDFVKVGDKESFQLTREITAKEGLCVGPSSALALCGAFKYAEKIKSPKKFVVIMADSGKAYLSKAFNDDWLRDNGFLPAPMKTATVFDLLKSKKSCETITAKVSHTVLEVINIFKEKGISQVPVVSDKKVVGLLNESDLLYALATTKIKPNEPVIHLVKDQIFWATLSMSLDEINSSLKENKVALVYDDHNLLQIITKIDLLSFVGEKI